MNSGTGSILFRRDWLLTVSAGDDSQALAAAGLSGPPSPMALRDALSFGTLATPPSPLRMTFDVEADVDPDANKATVAIANLTASHRTIIRPSSFIELRAGYDGQAGLLFCGTVAKVMSKRDGPDIVTAMECGDAEPALVYGFCALSYGKEVSLGQILTDVAAALKVRFTGLVSAAGPGASRRVPAQSFGRGFAYSGSCAGLLTQLLEPLGYEWFVSNGALNVLPRDTPHSVQATVLSAQTGLVGVPSKTESGVTFGCLINSAIGPGALVRLQSTDPAANGYFRVCKVKTRGDTHGGDWTMEVEASEPLPDAIQGPPTISGLDFRTPAT